ncbi:MAG: DUF885 domain-containing protein [Chitinophagales bacterium]|nr:DUF885 domain-containing protein [Chitinophagales bacterium]
MFKNYLLFTLFASMFSISSIFAMGNKSQDKDFDAYKETFFKEYWALNPGYAASVGLTDYAGILIVPSSSVIKSETKAYQKMLKKVLKFKPERLSASNRTDRSLLENQLKSAIWYSTQFKSFEWDPSSYNTAGMFDLLLTNEDIEPTKRLRLAYNILKDVPAYYSAAQNNIKTPTKEHTELAVPQLKGATSTLKALSDFRKKHNNGDLSTEEQAEFDKRLDKATDAVDKYSKWLSKKLESKKTEWRSFRIGKPLFDSKFTYDIQSGYSASEIYLKALNEKQELHRKMAGITTQLWKKYFPDIAQPTDDLKAIKMMIDRLSMRHVSRDSLIIAIRQQLPTLVNFIKDKNIVYLDPSKPLEVRETPEYMRGVAGASISSPGVFEKSRPTYYNVTPLDEYTEEQAESYLREYNHYMLQILNIHEAIPGHYIQLIYSNQSPSLVKSIFGNGAMIEGWACYTERMMLEEGYGATEQPEMWLMYYKWNLRIACNTILDYSVHTLDMSKEQALDLLTKEAFQQQTEAAEKWQRCQLTQVQLCSYYTGLTEIYDFRQSQKKKLGSAFNLKAFHEQFLSYGSAPVPEIKKMMEEEQK